MPTLAQINQVLKESQSLKLVALAYSEIAAHKLQKIRLGIEKNRHFFQEMTEVYHVVRVAAARQHILPPVKNQATISMLLTSNQHFYGNLENDLTKFYIAQTSQAQTDCLVIGKVGSELLKSTSFPHPFQSLILSSDLPTAADVKNLVQKVVTYQHISAFYPRMQGMMSQEPHMINIVQKPPEAYLQATQEKPVHFIFEPELFKMLQFFDNQIVTLLLEQTFLEAELARTAARMISMDQAQIKADAVLKQQKLILALEKRSQSNLRLLETVVALQSLNSWSK